MPDSTSDINVKILKQLEQLRAVLSVDVSASIQNINSVLPEIQKNLDNLSVVANLDVAATKAAIEAGLRQINTNIQLVGGYDSGKAKEITQEAKARADFAKNESAQIRAQQQAEQALLKTEEARAKAERAILDAKHAQAKLQGQEYVNAGRAQLNEHRAARYAEQEANAGKKSQQAELQYIINKNNLYNQALSLEKRARSSRIIPDEILKDIEKFRASLLSGTDDMKKYRGEYVRLVSAVRSRGLDTTSFSAKTLNATIDRVKNVLAIGSVTLVQNALSGIVRNVREVDAAMTELKKVTDETDASYRRFLSRASETSKSIGSPLSEYTRGVAEFARLGYDMLDAEQMGLAATVYKNVGDGIESITDASDAIIATMKAFDLQAEDSMSIVDKYNEIGNNYAISSAGLGASLQRSAAALASANNTLEESMALTVAGNNTIQNPEVVGTTLKTVSMYLRAAKTEAEEAGESTDGMANSVSELRNQILALTDERVDIMADDSTYKSTFQILREISNVWSSMADIDQANLLELIGGKRNASVVAGILTNFDDAEDALNTALNADGSAMAENTKYLESVNGAIEQVTASWESLSAVVLDDNVLAEIIRIGGGALDIVSELADAVGSLTLVLGGASVVGLHKGAKYTKGLASEAVDLALLAESYQKPGKSWVNPLMHYTSGGETKNLGAKDIAKLFRGLDAKSVSKELTELSNALRVVETTTETTARSTAIDTLRAKFEAFAQSANEPTTGLSKFSNFLKNNWTSVVGVAATAISLIGSIITNIRQQQEEAVSAFADASSAAEDSIKEYEDYSQRIVEANGNIRELYNIKQDLIAQYGNEAAAIGLTTDALSGYIAEQKKAVYTDWWAENADRWYKASDYMTGDIRGLFKSARRRTAGKIDVSSMSASAIDDLKAIFSSYGFSSAFSGDYQQVALGAIGDMTLLQLERAYTDMLNDKRIVELFGQENYKAFSSDFSRVLKDLRSDSMYSDYKEAINSISPTRILYGDWDVDGDLDDKLKGLYNGLNQAQDDFAESTTVEGQIAALEVMYQALDEIKDMSDEVAGVDSTLGAYLTGTLIPNIQSIFDENPILLTLAMPEGVGEGMLPKGTKDKVQRGIDVAQKVFGGMDAAERDAIISNYTGWIEAKDAGEIEDYVTTYSQYYPVLSLIGQAAAQSDLSIQDFIDGLVSLGVISGGIIQSLNSLATAFMGVTTQANPLYTMLGVGSGTMTNPGDWSQEDIGATLEQYPHLEDNLRRIAELEKQAEEGGQEFGARDVYNEINEMFEEISKANFDDASDSISEMLDVLEDSESTIWDTEEAWDSIQNVLGVTDETFDNTAERVDILKRALNGDTAAIEELQRVAYQGATFNVAGAADFSQIKDGLVTVEALGQDAVNRLTEAGLFRVETKPVHVGMEYIGEGGEMLNFSSDGYADFIVPTNSANLGGHTTSRKGGGGGGGGGKRSITSDAYNDDIAALEDLINLMARLTNYYEEGSDQWIARQTQIIDKYKEAAAIVENEYQRLLAEGYDATDEEMRALAETLVDYQESVFQESEALFEALRDRDIEAIEDQIEAIEDLIEAEEERWEQREEHLQHQIDQQEALIGLEEEQIDLNRSIREERAELDKQLESAKAMEEYIDDSQRQFLFTDEDYERLTASLDKISSEAEQLYADYVEKISSVDVMDTYEIEYITNEYERQYELKLKEYEIAKQELALEKARMELENTKNNRNTRMLVNGLWQMVADPDAVREATEAVADAEAAVEEAVTDKEETERLHSMQETLDSISSTLDREEAESERMIEAWEDQIEGMEKQIEALEEMTFSMDFLAEEIHSLVDSIQDVIMRSLDEGSISAISNIPKYYDGGVSSSTGLSMMHGSSSQPEVVFNSADAQKLYNFVHGTKDLLGAVVPNGIIPQTTPTILSPRDILGSRGDGSDVLSQDNRVFIDGVLIGGTDGDVLVDIFRRNTNIQFGGRA